MIYEIGVVDIGGGLRGIYAAGVLDYCMDEGISFDLGIGISAGSANLVSYAAGQRGRNYQFYTEYAFCKQYMSLGNFIVADIEGFLPEYCDVFLTSEASNVNLIPGFVAAEPGNKGALDIAVINLPQ